MVLTHLLTCCVRQLGMDKSGKVEQPQRYWMILVSVFPVSPVIYFFKGDFQVTRCCNCLSNYMISAMSRKHPASCGCSMVSPTLDEDISVVKPYQARRASDGSKCESKAVESISDSIRLHRYSYQTKKLYLR